MTDHQYRARIRGNGFLQPADTFDVEMVGRLVEQEQVRCCDERTRQRHTLSEPAGE